MTPEDQERTRLIFLIVALAALTAIAYCWAHRTGRWSLQGSSELYLLDSSTGDLYKRGEGGAYYHVDLIK